MLLMAGKWRKLEIFQVEWKRIQRMYKKSLEMFLMAGRKGRKITI